MRKNVPGIKKSYLDYAKQSEYFVDQNELLKKEIQDTEKQKRFMVWVQEFSKKIIIVTFILYIGNTLFSAYLIYLSYTQGVITGLDTLISETNSTFRDVVGGYIIKSAIENAIKIGGNYYIGIIDARLRALKKDLKEKKIISSNVDNEFNYTENNDM